MAGAPSARWAMEGPARPPAAQKVKAAADRAAAREMRRIDAQISAVDPSLGDETSSPRWPPVSLRPPFRSPEWAAPATLEVLQTHWKRAGKASTNLVHFSGEPFD